MAGSLDCIIIIITLWKSYANVCLWSIAPPPPPQMRENLGHSDTSSPGPLILPLPGNEVDSDDDEDDDNDDELCNFITKTEK